MVEKQRYSLDGFEMRDRVRGYTARPMSDIKPRTRPSTAPQLQTVVKSQVVSSQKTTMPQPARILPAQQSIQHVAQPLHSVKKSKKRFSVRSAKTIAFAMAAFIMIGVGIFLSYQGFKGNQQVAVQAKALAESAASNTDDKPTDNGNYDETPPPADLSSYKVTADMPRFISIPDVGVMARIKRVGTLNDNTVDAPKNVFDVGWYEGSTKPGEAGAMFLDGHVSGPTVGGIFANLKRINSGDAITIERGDGKKLKYKVTAKEFVDADRVDMAKALRSYDPNKQGLNIMTCNGKFNAKTQTFDKRLIVYAVAE